ncbi:hypothetical protein NQ314_012830 [Rhamnusium bicolor]|uniref:Uncharacterized protein n=1 Tax=Rhamnusium bicolor TaxID=1586634 RepID=A0AAV8XAG2_9CUCU|nr:hypothetical protein NQ314_012830 [Rhamnusium bicolor]
MFEFQDWSLNILFFFTDAKRFIGRKFDDKFVSKYAESNQSSFLLVRGKCDRAAYQVQIAGINVIKSPEEVSAEVLKYLKDSASEFLAQDITEAVITVPAYFSNAQRKATKKAAELAGLNVLKLVTEPTAAAIQYVSDKNKSNSKILVFDFGGGTLDVSLINVNDKTFEVKAVYGDTLLGGRNIDDVLFNHFYKPVNKRFTRRLRNMCVHLKKKLSIEKEVSLCIQHYNSLGSDYYLSLTRNKFDELNRHIFEHALNIVKLCLSESGISKSNIDEVVLVGGSTNIPKIRALLKGFFNKPLNLDLNPDEAVAAGASLHAEILRDKRIDLEKYKVTEVTPLSLGMVTNMNYMKIIIPRNSSLPARSSHKSRTSFNNQSSAVFTIYEGERKQASLNNELGSFSINGLPLRRAGDVKFETNFYLDEDGILNVTAYEISTGKRNKLAITMGEFRLSEKRIRLSIEEAQNQKHEDDVFEAFNDLKRSLKHILHHILYDLERICSDKDRDFVKKQCDRFLEFVDKLNFTEIIKLEEQFLIIYNSVVDILKSNLMLQSAPKSFEALLKLTLGKDINAYV